MGHVVRRCAGSQLPRPFQSTVLLSAVFLHEPTFLIRDFTPYLRHP